MPDPSTKSCDCRGDTCEQTGFPTKDSGHRLPRPQPHGAALEAAIKARARGWDTMGVLRAAMDPALGDQALVRRGDLLKPGCGPGPDLLAIHRQQTLREAAQVLRDASSGGQRGDFSTCAGIIEQMANDTKETP